MSMMICSVCGYKTELQQESAAFCIKCGGRLRPAGGMQEEIADALALSDISMRYKMLLDLREKYKDAYPVEFEILVIGRLYERGGKPDFYRIPYWPLSVFETPAQFSKKECAQMLESFFENPQAQRVCELSGNPQEFFRDYYYRMARGYVDLCLKGKNENTSLLGFRRKNNDIMLRCAPQLLKMLRNIKEAEYPDENRREILADAFRRAFTDEFAGENTQAILDAENDFDQIPKKKRGFRNRRA